MPYVFNPITCNFDYYKASTSGGGGDVTGPASAVDGNIVLFDGTTGKVIEDSGVSISDLESYSNNFTVGSWAGPIGDGYEITIPQSTHGKTQPTVIVYEKVGSNYVQVETGVKIDSSDNITMSVKANPDLRFEGKIIIS